MSDHHLTLVYMRVLAVIEDCPEAIPPKLNKNSRKSIGKLLDIHFNLSFNEKFITNRLQIGSVDRFKEKPSLQSGQAQSETGLSVFDVIFDRNVDNVQFNNTRNVTEKLEKSIVIPKNLYLKVTKTLLPGKIPVTMLRISIISAKHGIF